MMMLLLRRLYRDNLIIVPPRGHLLLAVQPSLIIAKCNPCASTQTMAEFILRERLLGLLSKEDKNDCKRHFEYRLNLNLMRVLLLGLKM
jgi:hypothetical protein